MPRLGEFLLKSRALSESQLAAALAEQQRSGGLLGEVLLRLDCLSEPLLVDALTRHLGIPVAEPVLLEAPEAAAQKKVPYAMARRLRVLPLQLREQGRVLTAALCEPQNLELLDELRKATGCRIAPRLIGPQDFLTRLNQHYAAEVLVAEGGGGDSLQLEDEREESFDEIEPQPPPAPVPSPRRPGLAPKPARPEPPPPKPPSQPPISTRGPMPTRSSPLAAPSPSAAAAARPKPPAAAFAARANPRTAQVPVAQPAAAPRPSAGVAEQLGRMEATQRAEVAALRAMVELLIERGVFTREDYLARVRR